SPVAPSHLSPSQVTSSPSSGGLQPAARAPIRKYARSLRIVLTRFAPGVPAPTTRNHGSRGQVTPGPGMATSNPSSRRNPGGDSKPVLKRIMGDGRLNGGSFASAELAVVCELQLLSPC